MDFETFRKVVKKEKAEKPILFELEHDDIPTMKDVIAFHKQYQILLPEKYMKCYTNVVTGVANKI